MYEYRAKVVHIVDGDTVDLDIDLGFDVWLKKQRIRLLGIDAPESRTRDLEEKVYGLMAKDFVISTIPVGSDVIVRTELDDKGKFGRILGEIIYNGEVSLNETLILRHLVVRYEGQSKEAIKEAHLANRKILSERE